MLPFLAKIGPILIPTMAVFWCLGNLAGSIIFIYFAHRAGLNLAKVFNYLVLILAASIIGARISAVLLLTKPEELNWFFRHPGEIFKLWEPGYSFYGVIFFASFAGLWYTLRSGLPVWKMADLTIPGIALGHAIQSLGDFLAGAHPGIPTDLPWGISVTHRAFRGLKGVPLHPVMLYVAALGFLGFLTAWAWLQVRNRPGQKFFLSWMFLPVFRVLRLKFIDGELYFMCGAFYAIPRFFVEFFRDPKTLVWYPDFPLPQTQIACVCFIVICLGWYFALRAVWEAEQKGLPNRGWMKLCLRLAEGARWIAKRIPYKVKSKKLKSQKPQNIL